MKKTILFLFALSLEFNLYAQDADSIWVKQHYVKKEQYIPMRDGVRLFTAIYQPKDTSKTHPILFLRSPYSAAPYGVNNWIPFWKVYWLRYLKEGYCVVVQDVRGKFMSEGTFVNIRPFNPNKKTNKDIDEASDTYDSIDWLIKNLSNSNAKVGVSGISYPGFYAAMAALSGHPALKAVSPQAPVTDWFMGDDLHHNGAFFLLDAFSFYVGSGFGTPRPKPVIEQGKHFKQPGDDSYAFFLHTGALPNFTRIAGDSIAFWKQLMEHPNLDAWWQVRNDRQYVNHINPGTATLIIGGLFDAEDSYGTWNLYRSIEKGAKNNNKLVIGPWAHGQWGSNINKGNNLGDIKFDSNTADFFKSEIEFPFFNYYLKGEGRADTMAEATVFITGQNKWHRFKQWPPADEKPVSIYLANNHQLNFSATTTGYDEYVSDPANPVPYTAGIHKERTREYMVDDQRFAAKRNDVLVYETPVLNKDQTLAGPLTADLWTSLSTTDADFVVKLIDVYPAKNTDTTMNNYQMLVRGDIFRGRYRNSFSNPEAFIPGKITRVKYTMPDIAHTFKKGHRIMVQIQSSWFPLADRNPQKYINIYKAADKDFVKSTVRIWHNIKYQSRLILPVIR